MARTSNKVIKIVETPMNEVALNNADASGQELTQIQNSYAEERDLMNQILGQVQMARAISKFADVVSLGKLAHIKETKMYRAIAGKKGLDAEGGEIADVGTWEGFCRIIGSTKSKIDEDLLNLRIFGEEALGNLNRIGAGYRELRQLRKLPDDDKTALIEMAKSGDKESLVELLEDVVTKHAKEKTALTSKVKELEAEYKALDKVAAKSDAEKKQVKIALEKLQLRTAPWDERVAPFKEEIAQRQSLIDQLVARHLEAVTALDSWVSVELANAPGYDPEAAADMPMEVLTVLLHLSDAIERTATLVANAQHALRTRFGGDVDAARQQLLTVE
ncbi:MAG: hypothetical protein ABI171_01045 [Collimonas sp.]|uniref:hypothetical protein n=1 Tax=Collimonas sp. TaxID=1963772 RepID=UPI003263E29F